MDKFTGRVWVLGDDIDTDIIIPTEYLALKTIDDMKQYGFSPLRPELAGQIQKGDIIVAGKNFGCGSSREQAPEIIKAMGVQCVIAKSFARIFFRNSINNGLLLIEQPDLYDDMKEGDEVTVVMNEHVDYNGKEYPIASLPENLMPAMWLSFLHIGLMRLLVLILINLLLSERGAIGSMVSNMMAYVVIRELLGFRFLTMKEK